MKMQNYSDNDLLYMAAARANSHVFEDCVIVELRRRLKQAEVVSHNYSSMEKSLREAITRCENAEANENRVCDSRDAAEAAIGETERRLAEADKVISGLRGENEAWIRGSHKSAEDKIELVEEIERLRSNKMRQEVHINKLEAENILLNRASLAHAERVMNPLIMMVPDMMHVPEKTIKVYPEVETRHVPGEVVKSSRFFKKNLYRIDLVQVCPTCCRDKMLHRGIGSIQSRTPELRDQMIANLNGDDDA